MVISPPIQAGTIGMGDSLLLMVIALVVLGPRRLPQVGRQIGKLMYEFRKASNDFKFQMEEELRNAEDADRRKREEAERQRALTEAQQAVAQAQSAAQAAQTAAEVSQVPEAGPPPHEENALRGDPGPGAPTSAPAENAALSIETENIYDNTYIEPADTEAAAVEPAAASGLRVKPPSTGEMVEAARPGRAAIDDGDIADLDADETSSKKDPAAEETHAATESTAHHG